MEKSNLVKILEKNRGQFGRVLSIDYRNLPSSILDLSKKNEDLKEVDITNPKEFDTYLNNLYEKEKSVFGIGLYDENRCIYDHSDLFDSEEKRTLHLGIDLWASAGIDVLCPYDGKIHSFQNNARVGDYGPTIILEHQISGETFYTLYGHLSNSSLENLAVDKLVLRGEKIGEIGSFPENGNWGEHLHFEVISDMLGKKGDFPGVAKVSEREKYLAICPNPNLVLNIKKLEGLESGYKVKK